MKKLLLCILSLVAILSASTVCFAGDIPESLLGDDDSQVYFGEVKSVDGNNITVIQYQNIKGEFSEGCEIIYTDFDFTLSPKVGEVYLCGFIDENNPLYIWEVNSLDTKELKLTSTIDMSKRMQEYLNEGKFEEKEEERLLKIAENKEVEKATEEATSTDVLVSNVDKGEPQNVIAQVMDNVLVRVITGVILIVIIGILLYKRRKRKNSTSS